MSLNERLKKLREDKELTMEQLANNLGVSSKGDISRWENGNITPRVKTLKKYSDYFGVSIDWLKYGEPMERVIEVITEKLNREKVVISLLKNHDNKTLEDITNAHDKKSKDLIKELQTVYDFNNESMYIADTLVSLLEKIAFLTGDSFHDVLSELLSEYEDTFVKNATPSYKFDVIVNNFYLLALSECDSAEFQYDMLIKSERKHKVDNIYYQKNKNKIIEALNKYNEKDVDDGTTQAILTLLNHNHRDEED